MSLTRRNLLMGMVLAQPVAMSLSRLRVKDESNPRISAALNLRQTATAKQAKRPVASMVANGDESRFPGRISFAPTISDEIDKLAFNIGWPGLGEYTLPIGWHRWIKPCEDVAISILQDLALTYTEKFPGFPLSGLAELLFISVHIATP